MMMEKKVGGLKAINSTDCHVRIHHGQEEKNLFFFFYISLEAKGRQERCDEGQPFLYPNAGNLTLLAVRKANNIPPEKKSELSNDY